jgi:ribosomal protein L11 methyltransferase
LWQHVTVTALFAIGADESAIKESLQQICNIDKVTFVLLKDRVWEDECKKDFHAMQFGRRVWICPSWEDSAQLPDDAVMLPQGRFTHWWLKNLIIKCITKSN